MPIMPIIGGIRLPITDAQSRFGTFDVRYPMATVATSSIAPAGI